MVQDAVVWYSVVQDAAHGVVEGVQGAVVWCRMQGGMRPCQGSARMILDEPILHRRGQGRHAEGTGDEETRRTGHD